MIYIFEMEEVMIVESNNLDYNFICNYLEEYMSHTTVEKKREGLYLCHDTKYGYGTIFIQSDKDLVGVIMEMEEGL